MAIKGKSRRRSRARASTLAPRPQVGPRRVPLVRRPWFRRAAVGLVALAALLGGLRVWQNLSRSHALRVYDRALQRAQGPLLQHLTQGSPTSFVDLPGQFAQGQVDAKSFREAARTWEKDFKAARDAVAKLDPPGPLARANRLMARGIDMYAGVARLYVPAAIQKGLADAEKDPRVKQRLEDQVQILIQHAEEWRRRADEVYDLGAEQVTDLKEAWGIEPPLPQPQELPGAPQFPADQLPGGFPQ